MGSAIWENFPKNTVFFLNSHLMLNALIYLATFYTSRTVMMVMLAAARSFCSQALSCRLAPASLATVIFGGESERDFNILWECIFILFLIEKRHQRCR